jgi:hypothetical protein
MGIRNEHVGEGRRFLRILGARNGNFALEHCDTWLEFFINPSVVVLTVVYSPVQVGLCPIQFGRHLELAHLPHNGPRLKIDLRLFLIISLNLFSESLHLL